MHGDERHTGQGFTAIALRPDEMDLCVRNIQQHRTSGSNKLFRFAHCCQISRKLGTLCSTSRSTSQFQGAPSGLISLARGCCSFSVSQVITGVFLALYYVPSADHAHTVVSYIVKEVTSGSFVRSIHAYGSSGIIIMLLP